MRDVLFESFLAPKSHLLPQLWGGGAKNQWGGNWIPSKESLETKFTISIHEPRYQRHKMATPKNQQNWAWECEKCGCNFAHGGRSPPIMRYAHPGPASNRPIKFHRNRSTALANTCTVTSFSILIDIPGIPFLGFPWRHQRYVLLTFSCDIQTRILAISKGLPFENYEG